MVGKTKFACFSGKLYHIGWFYKAITRGLYDQNAKFCRIVTIISKRLKRLIDLPYPIGSWRNLLSFEKYMIKRRVII